MLLDTSGPSTNKDVETQLPMPKKTIVVQIHVCRRNSCQPDAQLGEEEARARRGWPRGGIDNRTEEERRDSEARCVDEQGAAGTARRDEQASESRPGDAQDRAAETEQRVRLLESEPC